VVRGAENVRSVVNEITLGAPSTFQDRSNDLYITGKVKASLLDAKDIFANSFKVVTERGTVYLMGIATRRETDRATEVVRSVTGVQKVVRVVEVVSEADLSGAQRGGTGVSTPAPVAPASQPQPGTSSRVPLPPMEPLPNAAPAPAPAGGVTTSPIR